MGRERPDDAPGFDALLQEPADFGEVAEVLANATLLDFVGCFRKELPGKRFVGDEGSNAMCMQVLGGLAEGDEGVQVEEWAAKLDKFLRGHEVTICYDNSTT